MKRQEQQKLIFWIAGAIVLSLLLTWVIQKSWFLSWHQKASNFLYYQGQNESLEDIVIIAIDDKSFNRKFGPFRTWEMEQLTGHPSDISWKWAEENLKRSNEGFDQTHLNIDCKIYHGEYTADSNGTITLDDSATARSDVVIGLDFTPTFTSLRPTTTARGFPITGEMKRLIKLVMILNDAMDLDVSGDNLLIRQTTDDFSVDPTAVSGEREFALSGYSLDGSFTLSQDVPLPCQILGYQLTIGA